MIYHGCETIDVGRRRGRGEELRNRPSHTRHAMATMGREGLTFTIGRARGKAMASSDADPSTDATLPPSQWMPKDARNRFDREDVDGMKAYLPGDASMVEIMASRVYYVLNGCVYDDEDSFVVMGIRPLGWGCRMAFFLFSVIFCFYTLMLDTNPIGKYNFSRGRNAEGELTGSSSDPFEAFVTATYGVWVVSIATAVFTYIAGRYNAKNPYNGQFCASFPFMFCNRTAIHDDEHNGTRCLLMLALTVWWLGLAAAASAVVYTIMAHMYVKRNVCFSWLLITLLGFVVLATLADTLSLGGPTGIYVQSRQAAWIASIRAVVLVPVQVILTIFFIWLCNPPWTSA